MLRHQVRCAAVLVAMVTVICPLEARAGGRLFRRGGWRADRAPAFAPSSAWDASMERRMLTPRPATPLLAVPPVTTDPALGATRVNPYEYYRRLYPKWQGGFHAHELQNLGVPPGDVGLRGNGIYWSPW